MPGHQSGTMEPIVMSAATRAGDSMAVSNATWPPIELPTSAAWCSSSATSTAMVSARLEKATSSVVEPPTPRRSKATTR
jgi:hypothetical protein